MFQIFDLGIVLFYKLFCTISGTVIHDNHRMRGKGLAENRIDSPRKKVCAIKGWDNCGDPGGTHVSAKLVAEVGRKLIYGHSLLSHGIPLSYSDRLITQRI